MHFMIACFYICEYVRFDVRLYLLHTYGMRVQHLRRAALVSNTITDEQRQANNRNKPEILIS